MTYAGDLTPQEAFDMLAADTAAVLVDVRTEAEWTFVGVPSVQGTRFVEWTSWPSGRPNPEFVAQAGGGLDPGQPIICLCRSGVRSIAAANALTAAGHQAVYNVLDGFEGGHDAEGHRTGGWRGAGLPWAQN
ncbi:MAG: rhodanese-like domain-containing protein [Actinomycetota bacterium]